MTEVQKFFEENKYVVIRNLLSEEITTLMYQYSKAAVQVSDYRAVAARDIYRRSWDGGFGDSQVPGAFFQYGDALMDTLMMLCLDKMQAYTGMSLLPNYTYWRMYHTGNELLRHTDRGSCEISATVCLGYDVSNVDKTTYPEYDWPMFIKDKDSNEIPVHMKPGDCIIYKGMEVEHWREKFLGLNHTQVFIHYNETNGKFNNYLDGRHIIGIPKPEFQ
jgi:hypothetical protein